MTIDVRKIRNSVIGFSLGAAIAAVLLWLWASSIMIAMESGRSPAVALSTQCPSLNSSMMPSKYKMTLSLGGVWHARMFVKPLDALDIVVEQRCFVNGVGAGASLLWVNNQLAAYSVTNGNFDQTIYDCHGLRLYDVCNTCWLDKRPKAKVYTIPSTSVKL